MKVLVIAPHPDDEVFGVGGTMARLADEGAEVTVAIVTKAEASMFPLELIERGRAEGLMAHAKLHVKKTVFMEGLPAALLDTVPHADMNSAIRKVIAEVDPDVLFIPFIGDIHFDHRLIYESCLVAIRPNGQKIPRSVYAYETLSETNWNGAFLSPQFAPNIFIDISDFLESKMEAVETYSSQVRLFPNERSPEAVRALAVHRGATVGYKAAEGFVLIRSIHTDTCSRL